MSLLFCENLSFGYDGTAVLRDLNFSVETGERICVVGENGSGKSTLLKGLLGLMPPLGGILRKSPELKTRETGYLPQESAVQRDFPAAVFEVVLSGRQNRRGLRPFYTKKDKAAALEAISALRLENVRKSCFRELSGGQRRRVLLARALCAAEKFLLLDEPAAGLDPIVQGELYNLLDSVNTERGITIIMVSHDMREALEFAGVRGKVLHLAGKQLFFGSAGEYRESEPGRQFLKTPELPPGTGRGGSPREELWA
ncbi:MAG: ATP-binding cassette domain-containing protein [Treponema sp.]|jgi:zinc transport system ATP-binding protein|nr:ATP-binding cassette domain-containing protein [Treponema sp.]